MVKQLLMASSVAFLIAAPAAFAKDAGGYIGIGAGESTAVDVQSAGELDAQNAADGVTSRSSIDDTDSAWKIFGGYKINRNFAVEGSYIDFGKFTAESMVSASPFGTGTLKQDISATGVGVAAVGILPLPYNFEVFGKAGFYYWDAEWNVHSTLTGAPGSGTEDDTGTDLFYGVGAGYGFLNNLAVRLEWERYTNVGDSNTTGKTDVDVWSVGLQYTF